MPDYGTLLELAKTISLLVGIAAPAATLFFNESVKSVATESVKKLFERKPKVETAVQTVKALPENISEEEKIEKLAEELQVLTQEDQELEKLLQQVIQGLQKDNQDAAAGKTIHAKNYFERIDNHGTMNFN
ncbi:MAG: hypothetical protein AAF740_13035 [Bacteroidota bacterium]